MTLYFKLLEKHIYSQQNTAGFISFRSGSKPEQTSPKIPTANQTLEIKPMPLAIETTAEPPSVFVTKESVVRCDNRPLNSDMLPDEIIAKIPVVLAEFIIQLNIDSRIDLHERIQHLHRTKKQLRVTKCVLLQNTNILLIKGVVRNHLEFYKSQSSHSSRLFGNLQETYVDIPFQCTTSVFFNGAQPAIIIPSSVNEFAYGARPNPYEQEETEDFWQINQISTAFYNEQPFCEMASSRIVELDDIDSRSWHSTVIEEKLIIDLTLKILQYRQVMITSVSKK